MWSRSLLVPVGVMVLLAVGGYALAEDVAPMAPDDAAATVDPNATVDPDVPVEGTAGDGMAEGETVEIPIGEGPAFEEEHREDLRERYFRLTEDFINPRALGLGSIGRVPPWSHGILRAGPFRYTPFIDVSAGWESNVFLDDGDDGDPLSRDRDERASRYWQIRGGVMGDASFMRDRLTFRSVADILYRDYSRGGVDGDWQGTVGLSAQYDFPIGFWVQVGATYYHLFDPIDQEDVPTRMERDQFDYTIDLGLSEAIRRAFGGRIKVTLGADVSHHNFYEQEFDLGDRQEVSGWISVAYNLIDELDAFVRYTHGWTRAANHRLNDGVYDSIDVGLDGAYAITKSGRILGTVFFGYRTDRFDKFENYRVKSKTKNSDRDDQQDDVHAGAQLRWLVGTRTTVSLLYIHDTEFSLKDNYQTVDRLDLSGNYIVTPEFSVRAAAYGELARPSRKGEVYRYGVGVGGRYVVSDFVDLSLSYDGTLRTDTDVNGTDYINHRVELGLTFHLR